MHIKVIEFINRRFPKDNNWCNGNCWWFATILCERFAEEGAERWYCPVEGHFVTRIDGVFYDWMGIFTPCENEKPILWEDLCAVDPIHAERLIKYCKM